MKIDVAAGLAAVFAAAAVSAAFAQGDTVLMKPIRQWIDNLNAGNMPASAAAYGREVAIIDEFPPHVWMGAHAYADWGRDFGTFAKATGTMDPKLVLGPASRQDVNGTAGYVVAPAIFSYKLKGRPVAEHGEVTFALGRDGGVWKIRGWAWSGPKP